MMEKNGYFQRATHSVSFRRLLEDGEPPPGDALTAEGVQLVWRRHS